jgi:hypothetical protein
LRPAGVAVDLLSSHRRQRAKNGVLASLWSFAETWLPKGRPRAMHGSTWSGPLLAQPLTATDLVQQMALLSANLRCCLDYDESYVEWLWGEMRSVGTRGSLVGTLLLTGGQDVAGLYVYYLKRGGISQVMHVACAGRPDDVLDHLFEHAQTNGAAAISGRVEPRLGGPLAERRCVFRYGSPVLVHSRHEGILDAVTSQRRSLTRMDGEWWMAHHLDAFSDGGSG